MCIVRFLHSISIISLYRLNWLVFVTYVDRVLCEVGTEVVYVTLTSWCRWLNPVHSENCAVLQSCGSSEIRHCAVRLENQLNPEDEGTKVRSKRRKALTLLYSIRSQNT
jgi:hypothetical protein